MSKTNSLVIQTPEGIAFPLLLASPVTRFLAWIVDFFCIAVLAQLTSLVVVLVGWISLDIASALALLLYFVLSIGYGIALEWYWRGQTIGKRLFRLRVVDAQGLRLQVSQVVIRNLLRFVDSLPGCYAVGGLACLIHPRAQRLGDLAANTLVIRNPRVAEPDLAQVLAGKYNSFRDHPHLAARLRQRVSVQEAGIALQSLLRRNDLDPSARVDLFREVAGHFRQVTPFPAEATEGIADEQYVRNVTDILFRTNTAKNQAQQP